MNNYENIKQMSKNKMADFLYALSRSSCSYPKEFDCKKCIAKSFCDIERKRSSRYSIMKWLEEEVLNDR